ncbi:DUF4397 domain-containing protein [Lutispora saccharofermentans]|uniref:DUF4397 domain-containing protein n=1 Tax=Lutispora saccharofermentans TaxID=3024236 RepID=A0ABT1ND58_9FIRM|nr:DUF4397 domain-containing protein [Lutispora saccharofermentans]MCQ1529195.1 DUF4397 domain-containing protein [Lutispora saccharofermentans]
MAYCPLRPYMECPITAKSMSLNEAEAIEERQGGFSFIRFLHASPNTPAVDIYIDDRKAVSNLSYASMAGYSALPSTYHKINVYPMGQKGEPLLRFTISPVKGNYRTFVLSGLSPNIQHRTYIDSDETIPDNESLLRFVHISPNAPAVDVTLETGEALFSGLTFGRTEEYIRMEPGIYSLRLRAAGTPGAILGEANIALSGGRAYTMYAIGILGGSPPISAIILSDGRR